MVTCGNKKGGGGAGLYTRHENAFMIEIYIEYIRWSIEGLLALWRYGMGVFVRLKRRDS